MPLGPPRQDGTTLLEVKIRSGVTHQIRCHLAAAGTPIVGDTLYGGPLWNRTGHALHFWVAAFRHPATGAATTLIRARRPEWGEGKRWPMTGDGRRFWFERKQGAG